MKRNAFGLFLYACFAITIAKEVSYYSSVFPASECYPVLATDGIVIGVEKRIAGFDFGIMESARSTMLHCFKIPPGYFKNKTVCVCKCKIISTLIIRFLFSNPCILPIIYSLFLKSMYFTN